MKLAAIGDLHCRLDSKSKMHELLDGVDKEADVLILAGDLTDTGRVEEMDVLLSVLTHLNMPILAVLGNHDHECDQQEALKEKLIGADIYWLDGSAVKLDGVGFIGTKGFSGGFGDRLIQPFGEQALKTFIQAGLDEAVRLENALVKMQCEKRVAVLHYAPVPHTLEGEPLELYPFLGSSRLADVLDRAGVNVAFHGHAHHGSPEGRTPGGIPVHNVARFVQSRFTERAYCLYEI